MYPEWMKMMGQVIATNDELRTKAWAKELPKFMAGKRSLKKALTPDHKPFTYQKNRMRKTLPRRISE